MDSVRPHSDKFTRGEQRNHRPAAHVQLRRVGSADQGLADVLASSPRLMAQRRTLKALCGQPVQLNDGDKAQGEESAPSTSSGLTARRWAAGGLAGYFGATRSLATGGWIPMLTQLGGLAGELPGMLSGLTDFRTMFARGNLGARALAVAPALASLAWLLPRSSSASSSGNRMAGWGQSQPLSSQQNSNEMS